METHRGSRENVLARPVRDCLRKWNKQTSFSDASLNRNTTKMHLCLCEFVCMCVCLCVHMVGHVCMCNCGECIWMSGVVNTAPSSSTWSSPTQSAWANEGLFMHANKGATKQTKKAQGSQIALILFYLRGPLQPEPLLPSSALSLSLSLSGARSLSLVCRGTKGQRGPYKGFLATPAFLLDDRNKDRHFGARLALSRMRFLKSHCVQKAQRAQNKFITTAKCSGVPHKN